MPAGMRHSATVTGLVVNPSRAHGGRASAFGLAAGVEPCTNAANHQTRLIGTTEQLQPRLSSKHKTGALHGAVPEYDLRSWGA